MGLYDELAERLERAEKRNQELEAELRYIRDLAANSCLSSSQKWAMWAVRDTIHHMGREGEEFTEISMGDLAKKIGMSPKRSGTQVLSLAGTGAIVRKERYDITEGHNSEERQIRKRVLVGLTLFSGRPKDIAPPTKRNHGGKRERCEQCGGENLEIFEAYICKDCGHVHQVTLKKETKGRKGWTQRKTII